MPTAWPAISASAGQRDMIAQPTDWRPWKERTNRKRTGQCAGRLFQSKNRCRVDPSTGAPTSTAHLGWLHSLSLKMGSKSIRIEVAEPNLTAIKVVVHFEFDGAQVCFRRSSRSAHCHRDP